MAVKADTGPGKPTGDALRCRAKGQRGLTLVELLVVLAVLAVLTALVTPAVTALMPGHRLNATASAVAAEIRRARAEALSMGRPVGFFADVETRTYRSGRRSAQTWPAAVHVEFVSAKVLQVDDATGEIRFFSNGTSTGGRLTLSDGGLTVTLLVDWFDGRVRKEGGPAAAVGR